MTDLDALIRAVLTHPHEDTPRLIFADFLDETAGAVTCPTCDGSGEVDGGPHDPDRPCPNCRGAGTVPDGHRERAAFIRVQCGPPTDRARDCVCELWGSWPGEGDVRSRVLGELKAATGLDWWGMPAEVAAGPLPGYPAAFVRRGFVDEIRCPLAAFLEHVETLFRRHPITRVVLTDRVPLEQWTHHGFAWWEGVENVSSEFLPACLLPHDDGWLYTTAEQAHEYLSAKCVARGRELAGLPQLAPVGV